VLSLDEALVRVRAIATEVVAPAAERTDRDARWHEEAFRALQSEGLGGLVVPAHAGGHGLGLLAIARVCEELGTACGSTAISFGMHLVGSAVIAAKATPEQTERLLVPIARGKHMTTLALSEPGTGSRFYIPETRLEKRTDDAYVARGTKSFVTNGGRADSYVMSTVAVTPDAPVGQFSCVLVRNDAEGLSWGPPWHGFGMRGNSSRNAELRDVIIPRRDLLGEEGDEIWYVFNVVAPYFLVAMAGTYLGIAAAALDDARAHVAARKHSFAATPVSGATFIQHKMGELWGLVARTRALVHYAASAAEAGAPDALLALCSAKAEVAECAVRACNEAMTLVGGRGYGSEARVQRLLRDARAADVMAPTTEMLRTWAGRALLGMPLLAD